MLIYFNFELFYSNSYFSVTYRVCLSETEQFTNPQCYTTEGLSYRFNDVSDEKVYFAAVGVRDADGLESRLSAHISLQHFGNLLFTNLILICIFF